MLHVLHVFVRHVIQHSLKMKKKFWQDPQKHDQIHVVVYYGFDSGESVSDIKKNILKIASEIEISYWRLKIRNKNEALL